MSCVFCGKPTLRNRGFDFFLLFYFLLEDRFYRLIPLIIVAYIKIHRKSTKKRLVMNNSLWLKYLIKSDRSDAKAKVISQMYPTTRTVLTWHQVMQINHPQVHILLEQIYGRYDQGWPSARPYHKHWGSWHHIKLGIYMVQLAMHNILLIYKIGASAPLLLLHQLFPRTVLEFLVIEYCSCVCWCNGKLKPVTAGDKLLLRPADKIILSAVRKEVVDLVGRAPHHTKINNGQL